MLMPRFVDMDRVDDVHSRADHGAGAGLSTCIESRLFSADRGALRQLVAVVLGHSIHWTGR